MTYAQRIAGIRVLSGGTDVHLVLLDLREAQLDGRQAEERCEQAGISVNRNTVPFDSRPAKVTSGLRVGTAALATRGFGREEFTEVADVLAHTLTASGEEPIGSLRDRVAALAAKYPLYEVGNRQVLVDHV